MRTPLHAVLGLAEIMRDNRPDEAALDTYQGYAQLIHDSGSHLLELINDVLDMSKIEAGRYDLVEGPVSLAVIVQSCIAIVARRAQEGDFVIENHLGDVMPVVRADERAVKQVVLNLLSNAVKFTRPGGKIVVSAAWDAAVGLSLSVSDTDIGIAPEHLPHITEPFWQVDDTHARRYEGTGLGLAISKRLMELHGGAIRIESVKDVGTTVEIQFPATRILN